MYILASMCRNNYHNGMYRWPSHTNFIRMRSSPLNHPWTRCCPASFGDPRLCKLDPRFVSVLLSSARREDTERSDRSVLSHIEALGLALTCSKGRGP